MPIGIKPLTTFLLACIFACAVASLPHPAIAAEQKVALIIGNAAYPTSRLKNPVNDAKAMAEKLRALGFDVVLRTDSNQRDMTRAISQFGQKLALGSVGLFYYAGHGMQVRGKNFLIPIDAEIETEGSVSSEAVDVDLVLNQLGPARLSMVILDACRNNPFERKFRSSASGGLAQIDAPTGTLLAYATAPGKVAADGNGSNGTYTEALLKAIDAPGLKVEDVFKQVRINVLRATDNQQTPWESSSLTGEFYFRAPASAPSAGTDARLRQAEQQRQELQKALEDERKKRDQDADLIRKEMEKLRAELLQMRVAPAAPTPVIAVPAPSSSPVPAMAIAAAKPTSAPPESEASAAAIVSPPSAAAAPVAANWRPRIALLEQSRGKLSLSKAMAILLDLNSPDDLSALLAHELKIKGLLYQSAFAMGVDRTGNLVWGGGYRWAVANFAIDTALEFCGKTTGASCKVVISDGEFKDQAFLDVVKALGTRGVEEVRPAYLETLRAPYTSIMAGHSRGTGNAFGFSSPGQATAADIARPSVQATDRTLYAAEWAPRLAMLANSRLPLTYSKAAATLLDITNPADLNLLLAHEEKMKSMQWQSAGAFGVDERGNFVWGGAYQWTRRPDAEETAIQLCARSARDFCRIVVINGDFRPAEFLEIAKRLGALPVATVRDAFLQGLQRPPTTTVSNTSRGVASYGFAPLRD